MGVGVFGGAVLVYYFILSRFGVDKTVGVLLMLIVFGGLFSYARATLAFSIYYLGLSFLIPHKVEHVRTVSNVINKPIILAIGIGLILSSYLFHRSMLILIALTPFVFLKFSKKSLFAVAFLSPLLLFALRSVLGDVLNLFTFDDVLDKRVNDVYSEAVAINANWRGVIGQILHYGSYVLCFFLISITINRHRAIMDNRIIHLFSFYVVLSYVALLCYPLFDGNIIYMHRFLKMTIIPIIILITYLYNNNFLRINNLKLIVCWSIMGSFLTFARYIF